MATCTLSTEYCGQPVTYFTGSGVNCKSKVECNVFYWFGLYWDVIETHFFLYAFDDLVAMLSLWSYHLTASILQVDMSSLVPPAPPSSGSSGSGSYRCEECGKVYQSAQGLKYHVNQHRGVYPYYCPYCTRGFLSHKDVKLHIRRQHLGFAELRCMYCQAGDFAKVADLKQHLDGCPAARKAMESKEATDTVSLTEWVFYLCIKN